MERRGNINPSLETLDSFTPQRIPRGKWNVLIILSSQTAILIAIPKLTVAVVLLERGQYNIINHLVGMQMLIVTSGPTYLILELCINILGTAVAQPTLPGSSPVWRSNARVHVYVCCLANVADCEASARWRER